MLWYLGAGLLQERGESSEQRPWPSFKTGRAVFYLFRKSLNWKRANPFCGNFAIAHLLAYHILLGVVLPRF